MPDDPPFRFTWRRRRHRVMRADGPERIADEWWRPEGSGADPSRRRGLQSAIITGSRTRKGGASGCSGPGLHGGGPSAALVCPWHLFLNRGTPRYAELQVTTNFSFLRGASHPDELVLTAAALGHRAIAITDRNSFAGIVRAHHAAKEVGIRLVVGCRLDLADGTSLLAYPTGPRRLWPADATVDPRQAPRSQGRMPSRLRRYGRAWRRPDYRRLAIARRWMSGNSRPGSRRISLAAPISPLTTFIAATICGASPASPLSARQTGLPLVATNDVLYHLPERRPLQDVRDLHPRGLHDRRSRLSPRRQCRAPSEAAGGDGAAVSRP